RASVNEPVADDRVAGPNEIEAHPDRCHPRRDRDPVSRAFESAHDLFELADVWIVLAGIKVRGSGLEGARLVHGGHGRAGRRDIRSHMEAARRRGGQSGVHARVFARSVGAAPRAYTRLITSMPSRSSSCGTTDTHTR